MFTTLLGMYLFSYGSSSSPQQSQNQNINTNHFNGYNAPMNHSGLYFNSQNFYPNSILWVISDLQQNYYAQLIQNQNYMMAQMQQGQNMQGGYQMNGFGSQNNGGQQRRWLLWYQLLTHIFYWLIESLIKKIKLFMIAALLTHKNRKELIRHNKKHNHREYLRAL